MRERILELLGTKGDLPPLPEIVFRLQEMIRDPNTNAKAIARLIEVDPVLAGRILRLSNSVYYARSSQQITTLPVAITKIGLNTLVKLVYSLKLSGLFSDSRVLNNEQFWRHSLAVAIFTQTMSRRVKASREELDIAYLAGLMHDIGIMVFGYLIPEEYGSFLEKAPAVEAPIETQETETFGIDHAELGSRFIRTWWEVDERIADAVRYHHFPFSSPGPRRHCEQMVHISNGVCNNLGITNGTSVYTEVFKDGAWEELGLSITDVENILDDVRDSLDQAENLLSM